MTRRLNGKKRSVSIFRSIFAPLFAIMILQSLIFYIAAAYGGIEGSLTQNAADILSERLENRKYELQTQFTGKWTKLDDCAQTLSDLYAEREESGGTRPLAGDSAAQISFLEASADALISMLRRSEVNGVFLILNDQAARASFPEEGAETLYGLCVRDMDPDSGYTGREDLQLERSPASIVGALDCLLDSWWEPKYTFQTAEQGDFYYQPLNAAWDNPGADGDDLAYCSPAHRISESDPEVISYSIPLIAEDGYPYAVLGVEISVRRLASLLPSREINEPDKSCYVLAMREAGTDVCQPIVGTGAMYSSRFAAGEALVCADFDAYGGFRLTGRGGVEMYGDIAQLDIYNTNNPFEERELVLIALVESNTLFAYIGRVRTTLITAAAVSLLLGLAGIAWVSRRFAAPVTALAGRVRGMRSREESGLGRLGIAEIDQLVDSIEELNRNVNRNSARTEFFSRMSHDMRTPMNAIISFSSPEMLQDATESVKDEYLSQIHASGELLLALINEVLDMTKIDSNKTELRVEPVRANALCEAVVPIISELAAKKAVRFEWRVDMGEGEYVLADKQHINQIVMNLLSNAVKFTPEGGTVRLSVGRAEGDAREDTHLCRITVADTGIGMSEAFLQNLYTPFEQENENKGGTGLGLSIAKKLVDLMDGSIACDSRRNEGTTFTVELPLKRCAAPADTASPARSTDLEALRGKRILICEDNNVNILIIESILNKRGILTRTVTDGQAGVNAFAASAPGDFDAILMDIRMPVMDGLTATRRIRALTRQDAAVIPIIAMTADAFDEDVRASDEAGMNAHLAKPIEYDRLFETLLSLLTAGGTNGGSEK